MDEADETVYTAEYSFVVTVENGQVICGVLTEDTTLTPDRLWILRGSLKVNEGVTLTVEPGTHIFFERAYTGIDSVDQYYFPFMEIWGTANFNGTAEKPIYLDSDSRLKIYGTGGRSAQTPYYNDAEMTGTLGVATKTSMSYVIVDGGPTKAYSYWQNGYMQSALNSCVLVWSVDHCRMNDVGIAAHTMTNSVLNQCAVLLGVDRPWDMSDEEYFSAKYWRKTLMNECLIVDQATTAEISDSVFINTVKKEYQTPTFLGTDLERCAILNPLNRRDEWFRIRTNATWGDQNAVNSYWGTDNASVIDEMILDSKDMATYGTVNYAPFLTKESDMTSIYPFVLDAYVTDEDGNRIDTILGAQTVTFHVLFNRDMNQNVQPNVAYGGASPYNDNRLTGDWASSREWTATAYINPVIEYGIMYFYVNGAVAAGDGWLKTAPDTRLWFTIASAGAEAMVLQSSADQDGIHLSWTQDDFDTLAGYNLYRSQSLTEEGKLQNAVRLNEALLPYEEMAYLDADVTEGETYYYMFTVMQTDFAESDGSNISACTALDMTKPVIVHTPVDAALAGASVNVSAEITDNVGVVSATLYARAAGVGEWQSVDMTNVSGSLWYVTIAAGQPGTIEYYISAYDGTGSASHGTPDAPHAVVVSSQNAAKGDANLDGDVDILDLTLTAQYIAGMRTLGASAFTAADINGDGAVDIFDLMRVAQYICGMIASL